MERSDDERADSERSGAAAERREADRAHLAPVTYLPGVQPPDRSTPAARAASQRQHPSFGAPASGRPSDAHPAARAIAGRAGLAARPTFAAMYDSDDDDEPGAGLGSDTHIDESPARDRDAELARAENVSMHALTRRGQSRRELERTLRSRDLPDDVISHEVERLERVGLIDDVALAQNLVGVLQERKGLGRTGIASELTRRLLSPAAIEYALELVDSGDELARARELAVKRAGQLSSYDRATAERRLSGFLARRGYSGSTVRAAVDHALSGRRDSNGVRFR